MIGNTIQVLTGSPVSIINVNVNISASFEPIPAGTITGNSISGTPDTGGGAYNILATGDGPIAIVGNSCDNAISNGTTGVGGITANNT